MIWKEKERVNLGALKLVKYSHYERKAWHGEDKDTCHRYVFVAPTGERFVYSGVWLGVKVGETVDLRATVKRVETKYNCVRLARVVVNRNNAGNRRLL